MNITPINNTNFQARLDISKVKTNKARWQNIAKIFREETKLIPDETMKVVEHEYDTSIMRSMSEEMPEIGSLEAITFNTTIDELLGKYKDETIAKKLKKLLDIGSIVESRKDKAFEKYQALADKQHWLPKDTFIESRDLEYYAIENAAKNKANKDAFLRNFTLIV